MKLLVGGILALDDLRTPHASGEAIVGGAGIYASVAASFFTQPGLVGPAGIDFPPHTLATLRERGVALDGVPRLRERSFHWSGEYRGDMAQAITHQTRVEILAAFSWDVPAEWRQPAALLLCNNDPSIQLRLLEQVQADWVATDSMNLWIEIQRDALEQVVAQTDLLFLNDAEALAYSGAASLDAAGVALLDAGPRFVVIKRGAAGATLYHAGGDATIPAHPAAQFIDPTGAGDTFAGAACGWLAERTLDAETLVEALHHGSALASATVEGLGTTALLALSAEEAARRRAAL
ncbi:MAG: sugar kinase [Euryarchaeota archaeon]|nr:sugar kinase [Euryarchaeota archaeon]MDP6363840.1 PfkB family carbohydrate kinase [Candidatus Poseidoniia archaeon]MDP6658742.1 PfkB family carbohydrate kinase [Candidatus Poseidoniia archaeon]MDP6846632.1 PfkB family carbohydrate kinase [Candidatus Poseidoniia archaeon]MDP7006901.1 PfkB family carbohydrate kinase [Candidatus Poseidoniia archaeon]